MALPKTHNTMKRLITVVFLILIFNSCSDDPSSTSEPDLKNVWEISSNDTTAHWTGEEVSTSGLLVNEPTEGNGINQIRIVANPSNKRAQIYAELNTIVTGEYSIKEYLKMYSQPISTNIIDFEPREVGSFEWNLQSIDGNIGIFGSVDCKSEPEQVKSFSIIYEDDSGTLMRADFEAHGLEQTVHNMVCS